MKTDLHNKHEITENSDKGFVGSLLAQGLSLDEVAEHIADLSSERIKSEGLKIQDVRMGSKNLFKNATIVHHSSFFS